MEVQVFLAAVVSFIDSYKTQYKTVANTPLIEHLAYFWAANSEYAQFKRDVR